MTDTQLIIAVAKLDNIETEIDEETKEIWQSVGDGSYRDYLNSRDAIIPVIEKVCTTKQLKEEFICCLTLELDDTEHFSLLDVFNAIARTTPKQLSVALLKATGKWRE